MGGWVAVAAAEQLASAGHGELHEVRRGRDDAALGVHDLHGDERCTVTVGGLENQPTNTVAGTVNTTDPDSGDSFAYALVTGDGDTDNDAFTVNSNTLRTAVMFDFEGRSTYSLRVRSMDRGGLSVEKAFAITVTDTNEAPSDITLSDSSVLEDQPVNAVVGAFSTADPDRGNTCTYSLASGEGGSGNDCFTVSSSSLQTVAPFNFEGKSGYDIRVRSTDQEGLWFEKTFTITVADANEAPATPTSFLPADAAVNEPPTVTFQTSAFGDPDSGDAHAASPWLTRRVAGSALVFDSGQDTPHLTSLSLAASLLDYGATYDWQVCYEDAHDTWSGTRRQRPSRPLPPR